MNSFQHQAPCNAPCTNTNSSIFAAPSSCSPHALLCVGESTGQITPSARSSGDHRIIHVQELPQDFVGMGADGRSRPTKPRWRIDDMRHDPRMQDRAIEVGIVHRPHHAAPAILRIGGDISGGVDLRIWNIGLAEHRLQPRRRKLARPVGDQRVERRGHSAATRRWLPAYSEAPTKLGASHQPHQACEQGFGTSRDQDPGAVGGGIGVAGRGRGDGATGRLLDPAQGLPYSREAMPSIRLRMLSVSATSIVRPWPSPAPRDRVLP